MSILERDCVLVSKDESGNTIIDMPVTRVNNVEGLGRNPGTAYSVGDVVMCSGSKQLQLICTTAGTTSTADLDISANSAGDTINDGTVTWVVAKRNYFNTSGALPIANGGTGATTPAAARTNLGINNSIGLNPVGTIIAYAANGAIPDGYLPCNGAAVSRVTYAALFAVIGTLYGEGDGSTTFNLPDVTDRFLEGSSTAGNKITPGLPNLVGGIGGVINSCSGSGTVTSYSIDGCCKINNRANYLNGGASGTINISQVNFDASKYNSIFGNSNTIQPPALSIQYLIKY